MKPMSTIVQTEPLCVSIKKNGRPVQIAIAKEYVEKHFPHVENWKFTKISRAILAEAQKSEN